MNKTHMNKLKSLLEESIDEWIKKNMGEWYWPDTIIGEETESLMADAAFAVFSAIVEAIEYGKREGLIKDE